MSPDPTCVPERGETQKQTRTGCSAREDGGREWNEAASRGTADPTRQRQLHQPREKNLLASLLTKAQVKRGLKCSSSSDREVIVGDLSGGWGQQEGLKRE